MDESSRGGLLGLMEGDILMHRRKWPFSPFGGHGPLQEPGGSLGHLPPEVGPRPKLGLLGPDVEGVARGAWGGGPGAEPWRPALASLCLSGLQGEVLVSAPWASPAPQLPLPSP